jgi:hypothetical protein
MIDLSPADEAIIPPTSSVEVQFTCPSYNTTYAGTKNWTSYWVHFSTSSLRSLEGDFVTRYEVGIARAFLIPGTAETCGAFLAEPYTQTPDTYWWFSERINCDAKYCAEFSPLSSFAIVTPIPPGGSGKQPKGSTGGVKYLNAYVGCGVTKETTVSNSCSSFDKMGAFFETNQAVKYKVCIRSPKGRTHCVRNQEAKADTLYAIKITATEPGRYKVTWTVEGRVITRYLRRFRGAASAAPTRPYLSYGKAQAEAQKYASHSCTESAGCQYWAASCARNSPSNVRCIKSDWNPGVVAGEWIRCDDELIIKATRYEVATKPVLGSVQCYSTHE